MECGSYRAIIKLLEHAMSDRRCLKELQRRITEELQIYMYSFKFGFRPRQGTTDAIFTVR